MSLSAICLKHTKHCSRIIHSPRQLWCQSSSAQFTLPRGSWTPSACVRETESSQSGKGAHIAQLAGNTHPWAQPKCVLHTETKTILESAGIRYSVDFQLVTIDGRVKIPYVRERSCFWKFHPKSQDSDGQACREHGKWCSGTICYLDCCPRGRFPDREWVTKSI